MVKNFKEFRDLIDEIMSFKMLTLENIEEMRVFLMGVDIKRFGEFEEDAEAFIKRNLNKLPEYYKVIKEKNERDNI